MQKRDANSSGLGTDRTHLPCVRLARPIGSQAAHTEDVVAKQSWDLFAAQI